MDNKKYYSERRGLTKTNKIDFEMLKKLFYSIYQRFEDGLYFQQATGYQCVDKGEIRGFWGGNIEAFIYTKLRLCDVWPIEEKIDQYDEATLFSFIEFLYDYVSKPTDKWYHRWDGCGWHSSEYDKEEGQSEFREEINVILKDYSEGYELSYNGEILETAPFGLKTVVEEIVETSDPRNIDSQIKIAISKYLRYNSTIEDKKEAVRTLGDVLEYLRKSEIKLPKKDDSDLFQIMNNFGIRHHNPQQKNEYDKEIWYDWMFYVFLISIKTILTLERKIIKK
ncbi:hypothetical protein [Methanosarcina sp. 2.H.A.1B.4]|uniref:hypothetical protein n=1 Tax=Methanosarcina sp. 2.H.A.1B.4 TaxID=1483600 RepID=UPI0006218B86|nr:hypothetical protein [Methanosarcina sp. 2.H.A.1B.4]KKG11670.1 hypothetical protein EO92_12035 [Methanosarcina sp. 2.H.A.1B.4]